VCGQLLRLQFASIRKCFNSVSSSSFYPRWLLHLIGFTVVFSIILLAALVMLFVCPCLMCWRINFKQVVQASGIQGGAWKSGPYVIYACISPEPQVQTLPNFLCLLPVLVGTFFLGGAAVRYVLPVYWMTSFPIMDSVAQATYVGCKLKMIQGQYGFHVAAYAQTDSQGGSTRPGRNLLSTIALFFSYYIICQCAVHKLELSSDVNMLLNGVTKKFSISKIS